MVGAEKESFQAREGFLQPLRKPSQVNLVSHAAVADRLRREIDRLPDFWKTRYRPLKGGIHDGLGYYILG